MNEHLSVSQSGIDLIVKFEGFSAKTYLDPVGVPTIGFGTIGPEAYPGNTITRERGMELLREELVEHENYVKNLVRVPLNQNQFDALVSFCYNAGPGTLQKSIILKELNRGNYAAAAAGFHGHVYAYERDAQGRKTKKKVKLNGLVTRRRLEANLFMVVAEPTHVLTNVPDEPDFGVMPETTGGDYFSAIDEVVTKTSTFRYHMLTLSSVGATIASMFEQIKANPAAAIAITVAVISVGLAIWIKIRDTKEKKG